MTVSDFVFRACVVLALLWVVATPIEAADCNQNGVEDSTDIAAATSSDCDENGVPDECDLGPTRFDLEAAIHFDAGDDPIAIAVGDLNGDDQLDVVVAEAAGDAVRLKFNDGSGGFDEGVSVSVGDRPLWVTVEDVDGDGSLDVITANRLSDNVTILWNDGSGGFSESLTLEVDDNPVSVKAADLDGDGDLDLVTTNSLADSISLLEKTGTRTFGTALHLTAGDHPRSIVAVDADADGDLDLVTANQRSGDLSIFTNTEGSFSTPASISIGGEPRVVVSGDVNFDGRPDLIVASGGESARISIQRNLGGGQFEQWRQLSAPGSDPNALAVGDLTQNRALDIVVGYELLDKLVVYLNDAPTDPNVGFTMREFSLSEARAQPRGVVLGNFTGDAKLDVVTANLRSDEISLLVNSTTLPVSADCNENGLPDECDIDSGVSTDCNQNGHPDACELGEVNIKDPPDWKTGVGFARDCDENGVLDSCDIASGEHSDCNENGVPDVCDVTTAPYRPQLADTIALEVKPSDIAAADVDGDGDGDLVLAYRDARRISILENDGHGSLTPGASFLVTNVPERLDPVDLDGDGAVDLVVGPQGRYTGIGDVEVLYNDGAGGYGSPHGIGISGESTIADVDGDGSPDLVIAYGSTIALLINEGERAFAEPYFFAAPYFVRGIVAADLDDDGDVDIAAGLVEQPGQEVQEFVLWTLENQGGGEGGGDFDAGTVAYTEDDLFDVVDRWLAGAADFDGDGVPELVTGEYVLQAATPSGIPLARQSDGSYVALDKYVLFGPDAHFVDVDGSGKPDLITDGGSGDDVYVSLNRGDGSFAEPTGYSAGVSTVADMNGDGLPDLVGVLFPDDSPRLAIARNMGEGTFAATRHLPAGGFPTPTGTSRPVAGDVDGDGDEDFVAIEADLFQFDVLYVHENLGGGTFRGRSLWYEQDGELQGELRPADLDAQGHLDILLVDSRAEEVRVFLNPGSFEGFGQDEPIRVPVGAGALDVAFGDVDGDEDLDIVVANRDGSSISVFENQTGGSFDVPVESASQDNPSAPHLVDLDGDGDLDVLTVHPTFVSLLVNQGGGVFALGRSFAATGEPTSSLRTADLDGDGDLEVFFGVVEPNDTLLLVFENLGSGVFAEVSIRLTTPLRVVEVEAVDLDGDQVLDLVASETEAFFYARQRGTLDFAPFEDFPVPFFRDWRLADLEGDGDVDVVLLGGAGGESQSLTLHLNHGDASFSTSLLLVGASAIADFDGDGLLDLLSSRNFFYHGVYTLAFGVAAPPFSEDCNADGIPDSCQLAGSDCDASGVLDSCEIASGTVTDCQGDGVPDSCQLEGNDCNSDGIPDSCQLAGSDCDASGVLDSCEIASGTAADCNGDGVPDSCQLEGNDCNSNGIPDDCDGGCVVEPLFQRGDCNGDGSVSGTVTDAVFLLNFNFGFGRRPGCLAACDANSDGAVIGFVTDPIYMLIFSFLGGPPPGPPYPACGEGTTSDAALGCETVSAACAAN